MKNPRRIIEVVAVTPRMLRTKEAAQYLAISAWTLRTLVQDGKLPCDDSLATWRFDLKDLDAFIDRSKNGRL